MVVCIQAGGLILNIILYLVTDLSLKLCVFFVYVRIKLFTKLRWQVLTKSSEGPLLHIHHLHGVVLLNS